MAPSFTTLPAHKAALLDACTASGALLFGTFTLKSGRESPYFFNAGHLHRASALTALSSAFATTIATAAAAGSLPAFDVVFGPAYKGIPLAATTALQLAAHDAARFADVSYAFNRKEAKDHGEGGALVGAPLKGRRVLVVDDVVTAGTALREAVAFIRALGGEIVGIVVALDRMERVGASREEEQAAPAAVGKTSRSAAVELSEELDVPVLSVLTLDDIIGGLRAKGADADLTRMEEYREKYRAG